MKRPCERNSSGEGSDVLYKTDDDVEEEDEIRFEFFLNMLINDDEK